MKTKICELRRLERQIRAGLVRRILKYASPHFYRSGFIKSRIGEPTEYTRLVKLPRAYQLHGDEVEAITEDGIVCDSYGGAVVVIQFGDLSIKSLEKLVVPSLIEHE